MKLTRRFFLWLSGLVTVIQPKISLAEDPARPFGDKFPNLDSLAVGQWWDKPQPKGPNAPPPMNVPRDQVVAFAIYTCERGTLKMTAQLYPLKTDEPREARLEVDRQGQWVEIAQSSCTLSRLERALSRREVGPFAEHQVSRATWRVGMFEGVVRRNPIDEDTIVVANMSCNSNRTTGLRPEIIDNLRAQDPDLLFFAGDQTYRHTEHTAGWIEFGLQFRDILRDRPAITIPMITT